MRIRYALSCIVCLSWVVVVALVTPTRTSAEVLPTDQQKLDSLNQSLHKAGTLFRAKKYTELGKLVDEIEKSFEDLKNSESKGDLTPMLMSLDFRVAAAQRLVRAGLDHTATDKPAAKPATTAKTMPKGKAAAVATGGVSFVRDVAPLLVNKCGRCHIARNSGGFSVATYAALRAGSADGTVFNPGKGQGSRLIEVLETGDMPRGGGRLSDNEIGMIVKWIDAGAVFDGPDASMAIASLAGGGNMAPTGGGPAMSDVATGKEKVSFMRDIAPIIVGRCVGCHGGEQGVFNLEIDTFERLKKGGRSGDLLSAGDPSGSTLIQMLKGTAKDRTGKVRPRMPQRGSALSADEMGKFETWIAEGAKFDGGDPKATLDFLVRVMVSSKMSHEELATQRADLAQKSWATGNPGVKVDKIEGEDFVVYGSMPPAVLQEVADMISQERSKIRNVLKAPPSAPLVKGKLSIFTFDKRFELTEFARMVDRRELSNDTNAFFMFNVIDAYACIPAPKEGDLTVPLLIAEVLCGAHVDSISRNVPAWFSVGAGRAFAAKVEPRSPLVKHWDDSVAGAMAGAKPTFVNAKTLDGQQATLSYGLVKSMMANSTKFNALMDMLRKGTRFNQALQQVYGMPDDKLAQAFLY